MLLSSILRRKGMILNRNLMTKIQHTDLLQTQGFIDGKWTNGTCDHRFPVTDPATGKEIAEVVSMNTTDTQHAIEAAHAAFPEFRALTPLARSKLLKKWHALIQQHQEDLAMILTAECGKPLKEARGEIAYAASFIDFFATVCLTSEGSIVPTSMPGTRMMTVHQPIGVAAIITPWNFPSAMITRKLAPAFAAGCTAVVKPAHDTPLSAIALARLAQEAGFPKGVFNLVVGEKASEIGTELAINSLVRKLSFTGSTRVGKILMEQSASNIKKLSLELGGNAPFIVFDDADLDAAVSGAIESKFRNAGQTCICSNRFYIQSNVYDEFVAKLSKRMTELRVGHGFEEDTTIGPLINQAGFDKVDRLVQDAVAKGGKVHTGGTGDGLFYQPTLISGISNDMAINREEIFGPVVPLYKFETEAQVVEFANDTDAGLAGYFYSRDIGRVWRVAETLDYGMVGINTGVLSTAQAPFGGVKESGVGREGSMMGLEEYRQVKYICMGGLKN